MPLFDRVVDGEVVREVVAGLQERAERHALGLFARGAGAVEEVPGLAEVVVLGRGGECQLRDPTIEDLLSKSYKHVHVFRHAIIHPELRRAQLGQVFLLFLFWRRGGCGLAFLEHAGGFHLAASVFCAHVI